MIYSLHDLWDYVERNANMNIALTRKLAGAIGIKPAPAKNTADPLFSWTANWTNTFDRRKEDMVVMVNNANRFTVSIFGVKRNKFKGIDSKMTAAIRNTLLAMNLNPELVDEYMRQAGEVEFSSNHDSKLTAWVNRQGLEAAFTVGRAVNDSEGDIEFDDTMGYIVSRRHVGYSKNYSDSYVPAEKMIKSLSELTGKPAYKYRAFELLITLDLEIYKAIRRLIVPSNIEFANLHKLIQDVFNWKNRHLHDFSVIDGKTMKSVEAGLRLSDFFPNYKKIIYTYDMGDNWEHSIELVRVIEEHDEESPYLLEAVGQTPPEDVGGIGGFIEFREIMLDPTHPDHAETKEWAGYWSPELREWYTQPRVVYYLI